MSGSDKILSQKYSTSISAHIICLQIAVLWLCTLRKQCTYCIIVSTLQFNCSIDVTVDDLDRFDLLFFFRLTICPVVNYIFLHRQENSCGNTVNSVCCNYIFFGNSFFLMTQRKIISLSLLAANVAG